MPIDETVRARRRELVQAHMNAENAHDLEALLNTFSTDAEMVFDATSYKGRDAIAAAHVLLGMTPEPAALEGTQVVPKRESFTDDEIVIEGFVVGKHVRNLGGLFPPNGQMVELPYTAIYRFDDAGKLASERVVLDISGFAHTGLSSDSGAPLADSGS